MLSVHAPVRKPTPAARIVDTKPTVLITEQEVKLLTAAGLAAVPAPRPSLLSRWITAARSPFVVLPPQERPAHSRYVPRHNDYLESAALKRAMERL